NVRCSHRRGHLSAAILDRHKNHSAYHSLGLISVCCAEHERSCADAPSPLDRDECSWIAFIPIYADLLFMKAPIWLHAFNAALLMIVLIMHATIVARTVRKALRPESEQA